MALTLVTTGSTPPLSLTQFKANHSLNIDDLDGTLQDNLNAATEFLERETGRSFRSQTWLQTMPEFPCYNNHRLYNTNYTNWNTYYQKPIDLEINPVSSISMVQYYSGANVLTTWNSSEWILLKPTKLAAQIQPITSYPTITCRIDAVQITFVSSYSVVPPTAVQIIDKIAWHWYSNDTMEVPDKYDRAINQLRCKW